MDVCQVTHWLYNWLYMALHGFTGDAHHVLEPLVVGGIEEDLSL